MAVYLIAYDLIEDATRPMIENEAQRSHGYARLSKSACAIATDESLWEVYERFRRFLAHHDYFYVVPFEDDRSPSSKHNRSRVH